MTTYIIAILTLCILIGIIYHFTQKYIYGYYYKHSEQKHGKILEISNRITSSADIAGIIKHDYISRVVIRLENGSDEVFNFRLKVNHRLVIGNNCRIIHYKNKVLDVFPVKE